MASAQQAINSFFGPGPRSPGPYLVAPHFELLQFYVERNMLMIDPPSTGLSISPLPSCQLKGFSRTVLRTDPRTRSYDLGLSMEPASLTIGVVGLAGLFSACMDCFDYIQLGRTFGEDYGKCLLRLDAAKLRFSRWGEAMGIALSSQTTGTVILSDKDFKVAQSLLQQIVESFEDAEKVSKRYQRHAELESPTSDVLSVYDERTDLSLRDLNLHSQLRAMASRRQKSTGFVQKARWPLYEKRKFDTMISEITEFVGKLVDLFPTAKESQIPLCEMELLAIKDAQDLATLKTVAGPDDDILHQTAEAELKRRGHIVRNWSAAGNADVWVGDENEYGFESKGHDVSGFTVSGSAKVRLGNKNKRR